MGGLTLAASIAVGVAIGAATTVGATLSLDAPAAPAQAPPPPSGPILVQYGDRCSQGHCPPCDGKQSCLDKPAPER